MVSYAQYMGRCPHCGFLIDAASWQDEGHRPEVGDLTICQGCAHVLRFGKLLKLTAMTERDERALLALNPDILQQTRLVARRLLANERPDLLRLIT